MDKKLIIVGVLVVAAIAAGIFLRGYGTPPPSPGVDTRYSKTLTTPGLSENISSTPSASQPGGKKEFTITGQNYSFAPSSLTVKRGNTVKIIFKNSGGVHDFAINEFNVATKRIGEGEKDVVQFVADTAGTFEFYCSVGNHRAMGMKGTLVVE